MSRNTIFKLIAALVVVSAIIAPAASAQPIDAPGRGAAKAIPAQTHTGSTLAAEFAPSATGASSDGFDWGDAAIGAGAMLILLGTGAAGVVTIRHSRGRSHTLVTG